MTDVILQLIDDKGRLHGLMEKQIPETQLPQVLVPGMTLVFPHPNEDYLELDLTIVEWVLPGTGLDKDMQPGYRLIIQYQCVDNGDDLTDHYSFLHIYGFHRVAGFLDSEEREKVQPLPRGPA